MLCRKDSPVVYPAFINNRQKAGHIHMNPRTVKCAFSLAGLALSLALGNGCAVFGEKGCDKEITMRDLPAAVKPLAEKEVAGCKIIEVEQEMKDGKVIYAITYDQAGTKMEVEYLADGTLLSKGKE
jgi:hypothetical protein